MQGYLMAGFPFQSKELKIKKKSILHCRLYNMLWSALSNISKFIMYDIALRIHQSETTSNYVTTTMH